MPGRGRPRKEESSDAEGAKAVRRKSVERFLDCTEDKKSERKKKPKHTEEKPSVHSNGEVETTDHAIQDNHRQKKKTDNQDAQVRAIKGETCGARAETKKSSAEDIMKTHPDKPEGTSKKQGRKTTSDETPQGNKQAATRRACGGEVKSKEQRETTQTLHSANALPVTHNGTSKKTPNNTTKASNKTTTVKARGGKADSQKELPEEMDETQPLTKKTTKAPRKTTKLEEKQEPVPETSEDVSEAAVNSVLHTTLKNLRIRRNERSNAAVVVNEIIKRITKHLKERSQSFKGVQDPLPTGSYYENLKISSPDEFDVMLPILVERANIDAFGDDGAFYSVSLKRDNNPLQIFQENNILSASKMLAKFREEVKKCIKEFPEWNMTGKKKGSPAVTLNTQVDSITISLDVVLCLMVKSSWPAFTKEGFKIEGWLGTKVKQMYKREPYYLVPKYEGCGTVKKDGVQAKDVWRVSFSHIEKAIMKNHGSEKTCCEKSGASCCRKDCLKLLKHLLTLLKEEDSHLQNFCSYHAKTTVLHACSSRTKDSEWSSSNLSHCFQMLLQDFEGHLEKGVLNNFFIPNQNLLSRPSKAMCKTLADYIKKERHTGFPIFKRFLS